MKSILFVIFLLCISLTAFSTITIGIESNYAYPLYMKSIPKETINIDKLSLLSTYLNSGFYFNKNFGILFSIGTTFPLAYNIDIYSVGNNTKLLCFYDALLGMEYTGLLTPLAGNTALEFYSNIYFGSSIFDFSRLSELGYIFSGNLGIRYNINNLQVQIGVGCNYRNYFIKNVFGNNNLHLISVPITLGVRYKLQ